MPQLDAIIFAGPRPPRPQPLQMSSFNHQFAELVSGRVQAPNQLNMPL